MGTRFVALPDGRWTEAPDNLTDQQVLAEMGYQAPAPAQAPGFWAGTRAGIQNVVADRAIGIDQDIISAGNALGIPTGWFQQDKAATEQRQKGYQQTLAQSGIPQSVGDIRGPSDLLKYVGSAALTSIPDIALATSPLGLPFEVAGLEGSTALARARNNNQDSPSLTDFAVAAPLTAGNIAFQRFGIGGQGTNFLGRVGREALAQGAIGEGNYLGETVGTDNGPTLGGAVEAGVGGALVGATFGAGFHVGERILGRGRRGDQGGNPDDLGPIDPNEPTNLLQLPDYSKPVMYVTPQGDVIPPPGVGDMPSGLEGAIEVMNRPHDYTQTPTPRAFEDVPLGAQTDMFSNPVVASEPATQRAEDAGGQKPTQLPDPLQPSLFDEAPDALTRSGFGPREVRMHLTGGARPDAFVFKVTNALTRAFADGNIEDARKAIDREHDRLMKADLVPQTIQHRLGVLERANNLVETYNSQHMDALAQAGVAKAAPGVNVGPALEDNSQAVAQAQHQNEQVKQSEPALRKQLLDRALTTDNIRDPAAYYEALLKRNNLDPVITDDEFEHMYQTLETRDAEDAGFNEAAAKSGTAEIEAQIPPARKREVAAALNRADETRANVNKGITAADEESRAQAAKPAKVTPEPAPEPKSLGPEDALKAANLAYPGDDALATMFYKGATGTPLDAYDTKFASPEQREAYNAGRRHAGEEATPAKNQPEVQKLPAGKARGLEERSRGTSIAHAPPVEEAGDLTQTQIEQQDAYKRIGEARAANVIDDNEQALLTNMIRRGAPADTVKQAITDLRAKRARRNRAINKMESSGKLPQREADIERSENTPRKSQFPATQEAAAPDHLTQTSKEQVREGNLQGAMRNIATNHPSPIIRRIAQSVSTMVGHSTSKVVPAGSLAEGAAGLAIFYPDGRAETVVAEDVLPHTIVHEGVHAAIVSRIGNLEDGYTPAEWARLPRDVQGAIRELDQLRKDFIQAFHKAPPELLRQEWVHEALRSKDELVTYLLTMPDGHDYLRTVDPEGNPLKNGGQKSWWDHIVDLVRRVLRLPPTKPMVTALDTLLRVPSAILHGVEGMDPDSKIITAQGRRGINEAVAKTYPMYAGERAKGDDAAYRAKMLIKAKDFAAKGDSPELVKRLTGWEKSPLDGKWRYEVTDHAARWDTLEWNALKENTFDMRNAEREHLMLPEVFDHPEMYDLYPELREIKVTKQAAFMDPFKAQQGWYDEERKTLNITPHTKDPLSVALHEVQHFVQKREGFAQGGNERMAANLLNKEQVNRLHERAQLEVVGQLEDAMREKSFLEHAVELPAAEAYGSLSRVHDKLWDRYQKLLDRPGEQEAKEAWLKAYTDLQNVRANLMQQVFGQDSFLRLNDAQQKQWVNLDRAVTEGPAKELVQARTKIRKLEEKLSDLEATTTDAGRRKLLTRTMGHELYENIAGEIEARDTQARQALTPEERRTTPMLDSQKFDSRDVLVHHGEGYENVNPASIEGRRPPPDETPITPKLREELYAKAEDDNYIPTDHEIELLNRASRRDLNEYHSNIIKHGSARALAEEFQPDLLHHEGMQTFQARAGTREDVPEEFAHTNIAPLKAAQAIKDVVNGQGTRGVAHVVLGPKLAEMTARAGVKSATAYERLSQERGAIAEQVESKFIDLSERFDKLVGTLARDRTLVGRGKGSLNNLAKRSVFEGKWAFQPKWLRDDKGNPIDVEVDPALHREFMAMPEKARKVYEDGFRLPHEVLHQKRKAVLDFIEREHQHLLDQAQANYDRAVANGAGPEVRDELASKVRLARKHRAEDFKKFNRLFNVRLDEPYMPIRRFGPYVVVGRSPEYLAEEQASRNSGDDEKLQAMKSEPKHYFVDFAENNMEAERLRREVAKQFGMSNVEKFTKDESRRQLLGGQDMFHAFQRLRDLVAHSTNGKEQKALDGMITDLMLSTLVASSSRRAEMARLKVAGGNLDMMRGAISQGRADASFIAGVHKNSQILDALSNMRDEAQFQNGERDAAGRERRQSLVNEMLARHVMSMAPPPPNALADKATALTSLWMLAMSPSFYLQQLTQPAVMSVPEAAAKHGYTNAWREMMRGYKRVGEAWKNTGLTGSLKLDQLPEEYRPLAHFLAERGRLDVGIAKELGNWSSDGRGVLNDTMHNVVQKLSALTRKSEAINRLATGVMEYNLQNARENVDKIYDPDAYRSYIADMRERHPNMDPMTEKQFAAANHALKLIDDTHGNYDIASAPRFMRGPLMRILTQFKKFQIMQLQLYGQHVKDGFFSKDIPEAERKVARRALAFLTGHAAVMAGAMGLPGFAALRWLYEELMGQDGPDNMEQDIRKAVGDPTVADLLLHGAPSLAGVNLTGSIGQGNITSLAPYTDNKITTPQNARDQYNAMIVSLLGPAIGGLGVNMAQGMAQISNGDYYRGLERMVPRGLSGPMRAYREATQGETTMAGNKTADVGLRESIVTALGLNPIERTRRQFVKDVFYNENDYFANRGTQIRSAYAEAETPLEKAQVRQDWQKYQLQRIEHGLDRQPMSSLMRIEKAERRRQYGQGITYTRRGRRRAQDLQNIVEDEEQ